MEISNILEYYNFFLHFFKPESNANAKFDPISLSLFFYSFSSLSANISKFFKLFRVPFFDYNKSSEFSGSINDDGFLGIFLAGLQRDFGKFC
jgi:hypothetical protein